MGRGLRVLGALEAGGGRAEYFDSAALALEPRRRKTAKTTKFVLQPRVIQRQLASASLMKLFRRFSRASGGSSSESGSNPPTSDR